MRTKALHDFSVWLEHTPVSQTIQTIDWIVPAVQTVHILAIAAVMASVLMVNLRLARVPGREQGLQRYSARFVRVIWWALPVLLASGTVMVIGEPGRSLENDVFQLKMCLVLSVVAVTLAFRYPLARDATFWDATAGRRIAAVAVAVGSLALWTSIVFAGRWIAYY